MKRYLRRQLLVALLLMIASTATAEPVVLDGVIEPSMKIEIGTGVPGILETVDVEWGDMVQKGQVVATLQSGVEKATLELARYRAELESTIKLSEARLAYADREYNRANELYNEKVVPFSRMDETQMNRVMAELTLLEAKENKQLAELEVVRSEEILKRMTIRSPIDGVVVERMMAKGEYVDDQPILKLAQIDPLYVEVIAPVAVFGTIRLGMRAEVRPEEPIGGVHPAAVSVVDRVVDAASGSFRVRLELPNPNKLLPAGLKCRVIFAEE